MSKSISYNNQGHIPAITSTRSKGRLKYKPMPATAKALADAGLYRVQFRNSSFIAHPKRGPEQDWMNCTLPKEPHTFRIMYAVNLTKAMAERVVRFWQARPMADTFEFRIIPE